MSLERERVLLEAKINGLKRDRELKILEGEMFVTQVREELSPYLDFIDIDVSKAKLAVDNIARLKREIEEVSREITALERKLR